MTKPSPNDVLHFQRLGDVLRGIAVKLAAQRNLKSPTEVVAVAGSTAEEVAPGPQTGGEAVDRGLPDGVVAIAGGDARQAYEITGLGVFGARPRQPGISPTLQPRLAVFHCWASKEARTLA